MATEGGEKYPWFCSLDYASIDSNYSPKRIYTTKKKCCLFGVVIILVMFITRHLIFIVIQYVVNVHRIIAYKLYGMMKYDIT